jgi:hypothetical protein
LKEILETRKIRKSKSPRAAPILFVPKAHGRGLWLYINYIGISKITIANCYPLPIMDELQDYVKESRIFAKLNLKKVYHLITIPEWITGCRRAYARYELFVITFGLPNSPATFQDMINQILHDLLDREVVVYIKDILIYATNPEEHDSLLTMFYID